MRPRISIIIPLYNVEDYIEDCLKSILNQRFEEYEVILINDGSTDKSRKIIDKYAINDERIKVIHKNNEGASKARNLGIEKAKGEYIAFVDSDDTINNMMYEKMYSIAIHKDADIVACGYKEINYKSNEIYEYINPLDNSLELQGEEIKKKIEELLYFNRILGYSSLCNKLYKSECIKNNKLRINERIKIAEDLCFNIEIMMKINKIVSVNEGLYEYRRINPNSIMNNSNNLYLKFRARKAMLECFKNNKIDEKVYKECLMYENSSTIISYIGLIKKTLKSNLGIIDKYRKINKLMEEEYFLSAIQSIDKKYFTNKTKVILSLIKMYLSLKGRGVKCGY